MLCWVLHRKIQGVSNDLVPVNLEKATTGDDDLAIVRSQEVSALTKVYVQVKKRFGSPYIAS